MLSSPRFMETTLDHFATKEGLWMLFGVWQRQDLGKPVEWVRQWPTLAGNGYWNQNGLWLQELSRIPTSNPGMPCSSGHVKDVPSQCVPATPQTESYPHLPAQILMAKDPFSPVILSRLSKEPKHFSKLPSGQLQGQGDGTRYVLEVPASTTAIPIFLFISWDSFND